MNYEELLNAQETTALQEQTPFGVLFRKQTDKKYHYVLAVKAELADRIDFCKALEADSAWNLACKAKQQLHYQLRKEKDGGVQLDIETGNYQTFRQLLESTPAVVATSGFVDQTVGALLDMTEQLHAQQCYHLCYAPQNVLVRKGDEMPMLLLHASSFTKMGDWLDIYAGQKDFIAPEVLAGEPMTERSDVYSLGCFITWLFSQGSMPYEYKQIVAKAMQQAPEKRFDSVNAMRSALNKARATKHSMLSLIGALLLALLCVGLYVELVPQGEDIEFVEAAPKEKNEILLDEKGFDPAVEMAELTEGDSLVLYDDERDTLTTAERQTMETYMKKSEEIFRRQFTREAERILSKIYSDEHMNGSEKAFIANSNAMRDELLRIQNDLAGQAGISDDRAGRIASEVVDEIEKKY